ncbi:MAG: sulfatase-like hydrolase/transferase [Clostridia bacterium]|nr:sulfatase-like hydrolase/transferase [Clostridia bacterium]
MSKPAILLITCDELNKNTLSLYQNEAITTPNIDSIATDGVFYENAYTVSPWCLPARCAILTGLYPHESGAYSNFRKCPLDNGIPNIFTELKKASYHISMFGKCHFAPVPYGKTRPDLTLPYDEFKNYYMSLGINHLDLEDDKQVSVWFMDDWAKEAEENGVLTPARDAVWNRALQKVYPFPGKEEFHPDIWTARKAISHIKDANASDPFFAWISFSGPHYPMDAPQSYLDRVKTDKLTPRVLKEGELDAIDRIHHNSYHGNGNIDGASQAKDRACKNFSEQYWLDMRHNYNANVLLIDDMVGDILQAAKEKFGENVLVIFTADHGEMLGNHGLWGKHNCGYEEVWHIPFFIKYPDGARKGEHNTDLINSLDILPTCLEAAGADIPAISGQSLYHKIDRQYTFAEGEGYLAVTDTRHKYIHINKPRERYQELLDLTEDPCEFENKINSECHQGILATLRKELIDHIIRRVLP